MAITFNGSSDFIDLGNAAALNPTGSMSIHARVKLSAAATASWFVARDDDTLGRSFDVGHLLGTIVLQINGSNTINAGFIFSTGVWYSVCVVGVSGTSWTYYVDGVSKGTGTSTAPASTTGKTTIGKRTYSGFNDFYAGDAADVAMWSAALDAAEVAALVAYSPALIRPTAQLTCLDLDRAIVDRRGNSTVAATGTSVAVHPRVIYPRHRWQPQAAATSPPPPPPSTYIGARNVMHGHITQYGGRRVA